MIIIIKFVYLVIDFSLDRVTLCNPVCPETVFLCTLGWPQTHKSICLCLRALGLKVSTTTIRQALHCFLLSSIRSYPEVASSSKNDLCASITHSPPNEGQPLLTGLSFSLTSTPTWAHGQALNLSQEQ